MTTNKVVPNDVDGARQPIAHQTADAEYWEKRLQENWGLHGVGYLGYGVYYNRWLYKVRRHVFDREMARLDCDFKSSDVLDIGSGTGFWIDTWKALGVRSIAGSDVTQIAVERLQRAHRDFRFTKLDISGSLEAQNFGGTYNIISAFDVLFHITSDARFADAITNISRLLLPGGYFIFSDNFLHGRQARANHQVSRSLEGICEVVTGAGFRIVRRVPMFVLMNAPVDSSSQWSAKFWRCMMLPVRVIPLLGFVFGAALYPVELYLTQHLRESPSTEMMICQKTPAG
jgi:SAM-dependent methyltransferase